MLKIKSNGLFLPLTKRGIVFFLLSILIFFLGLLRADLAARFWGSGLFLICCYQVIANIIFHKITKKHIKTNPDSLKISLPATGLFANQNQDIILDIALGRLFFPGLITRLKIILIFQKNRTMEITTTLNPGKNRKSLALKAKKRGAYTDNNIILLFEDLTGFTRTSIQIRMEQVLYIYPLLKEPKHPPVKKKRGGKTDFRAKNRIRSQDLLEVRKYYPGDDLRKINWKIFALHRELFLRLGEETPPPRARFLFIIDTTTPDLIHNSLSEYYIDNMVQTSASVMLSFLLDATEINLSLPGRAKTMSFSPRQKIDLLKILAAIWWVKDKVLPPLPQKKHMHVFIFSTPGSPALDHIIHKIKKCGWHVSLLFCSLPFPQIHRQEFDLKRFLFIKEQNQNKKSKNLNNYERKFNTDLAAAMLKYKSPPWRLKDVYQV